MTDAAKMALLADTNDKRALYTLFCADEASHFHAISSFVLAEPKNASEQQFLLMLDKLVHEGSYLTLVYMMRIILEGWGLHHYRLLAAYCQDPALTEVFRSIVKDEAMHHGSGLVILPQESWTAHDTEVCRPYLVAFIELVQAGSLNLVSAMEQVLGPLTQETRSRLFRESGAELRIARNGKRSCARLSVSTVPILSSWSTFFCLTKRRVLPEEDPGDKRMHCRRHTLCSPLTQGGL